MDAWCSGCGVKYTFDPAKVPAEGVNVRCTRCNAVFRVDANEPAEVAKPAAAAANRSTPPANRSTPPMRRPQTTPPSRAAVPRMRGAEQDPLWTVRHSDGTTLQFRDMTTLQKWVVEQKVDRADEISRDGETWNILGELSELQSFFSIVDAANARGYFGSQPPADFDGEETIPFPAAASISLPSEREASGALAATDAAPSTGEDTSLRADATIPIPEQVTGAGADATQPMSMSEVAAAFEAEASGSASSLPAQAESSDASTPSTPPSPATATGAPAPASISEAISSGATDSGSFWATEISSALRTGELNPITDDDTIAHFQKKNRKTSFRWGGVFAGLTAVVSVWLLWGDVEPVVRELVGADVLPNATPPTSVAAAEDDKDAASDENKAQSANETEQKQKSAAKVAATKPAAAGAKASAGKPPASAKKNAAPETPVVQEKTAAAPAKQAVPAAQKDSPPVVANNPPPAQDAQALLQRAERLRESDRTAEALAVYREASELAPSDPRVLTGMGWCYIDLERFADATRSFGDVLKTNPRDALSHFGLAEASRAMGNLKQARDSYRRYLEIAPSGPDARIARLALDELEKSP